jgi:hypothetical protein
MSGKFGYSRHERQFAYSWQSYLFPPCPAVMFIFAMSDKFIYSRHERQVQLSSP